MRIFILAVGLVFPLLCFSQNKPFYFTPKDDTIKCIAIIYDNPKLTNGKIVPFEINKCWAVVKYVPQYEYDTITYQKQVLKILDFHKTNVAKNCFFLKTEEW